MASIYETHGSRSLSNGTITYKYVATGTSDLDEVRNLIDGETFTVLTSGEFRGEPDCQYQEGGIWLISVPYSAREKSTSESLGADPGTQPPPTGLTDSIEGGGNPAGGAGGADPLTTDISFSTGGGTIRIFNAIRHVGSLAVPGRDAPNHKGAINVQPDGTVEGIEVLSPKGSFSITKRTTNLTNGYFFRMMSMTATINGAAWRGFGTAEVLLEGVDGNYRGGSSAIWELSYHFGYSPTRGIAGVGDFGPFVKRGWDFLWFEYETLVDATAKKKVQYPYALHLEQVYYESDFNLLGL